MGSPFLRICRRRFLYGFVAGMTMVAGCTSSNQSTAGAGSEDSGATGTGGSGRSATHGGVNVAVAHHVIQTKVVQYSDNGDPCIKTLGSGTARLSVVVDIDLGDTDASITEIVDEGILKCDGDTYELVSLSQIRDSGTGKRYAIGFDVPKDVDLASCELELTWQGSAASAKRLQIGLGPERAPDIPEDFPSCSKSET